MADIDTYGSDSAKDMSLTKLREIFRDKKVRRLYIKFLAPNDNSKNQYYLSSGFSTLNIIPSGKIVVNRSSSNKKNGVGKLIFQAPVNFMWVDSSGNTLPAPNTQIILYPQYPEIRLSGLIRGSQVKLSRWMDPYKDGRSQGRVLLLGVTDGGLVLGYLAVPGSRIAKELYEQKEIVQSKIIHEISLEGESAPDVCAKSNLFMALRRIHQAGWIKGKRLDGKGNIIDYSSPNGGGYTLEAELGINPNGKSDPDYLGWELKQFGVKTFEKIESQIVTLMTPEPTGGIYKEEGILSFLKKFGYPDKKGRLGRINFGGLHRAGIMHGTTNLTLSLDGYDAAGGKITNPDGGIVLKTNQDEIAAKWEFSGIFEHWKKKHHRAAYIPSQKKDDPRRYHYSNVIMLGEGADIGKLLSSISNGFVYYDPGIKMEVSPTNVVTFKKRSQFRIKTGGLKNLYEKLSLVDILKI